jgi:diguanylate cyclase (GGDEF)-like protein
VNTRPAELPVRTQAEPPAPRRTGKILVADDSAVNRQILRLRLESDGHRVSEAANGREVLDFLREGDCDLLLLDLMMPEMDGFQTLAALKQDPRLRNLPVIMISAVSEQNSVIHCIEMGAEDYLPKPFDPVLLRARIGATLEKKWLRDSEQEKADELKRAVRLLEEAQVQLAAHALEDSLTGLANRRSVDEHLEALTKSDVPFSVIYVDLNGFKQINDTYGHAAGDELLRQVGARLRAIFRDSDFVARWGGDEFVALVNASLTDIQSTVMRISAGLDRDFLIRDGEIERSVRVSASVGVATWCPGESVSEAIQRADAAMYTQKHRKFPS